MTVSRFAGLFLLCLVLLVPAGAQSVTPTPVVTVYFSERPPFAVVDGQTGILINLTKAIFAEAGIRARFIDLPTNRILDLLVQSPSNALAVGWYRPTSGGPAGRFSPVIYQEQPMVALMNSKTATVLGASPRLDTLLSSGFALAMKVGVPLGPAMDQKIRALGVVPLETVVTIPAMLKMIQSGRMDYTLLSEEEATYLLKQDSFLAPGVVLVHLSDPPPGNLRYFLYPEGFDPSLADRIDAAIEKLKNSARSPSLARPFQEEKTLVTTEPPVFQNPPGSIRNPGQAPTSPKTTKGPLVPVTPTPVKP